MNGNDGFTLILGILVVGAIVFGVARAIWVFSQGVREGYRSGPKKPATTVPLTPPQPVKVSHLQDPAPNQSTHLTSSSSEQTIDRNIIFVSYRRDDSQEVAGRIYDRLIKDFDRTSVFKDVDAIPLGEDFRAHLKDAVSEASVFLAIIGPRWIGSDGTKATTRLNDARDYVRIECGAALERRIPVIPVLVSGALMPSESDLPSEIAGLAFRNAIQVRHDPDFHNDMDRLTKGIQRILVSPRK